MCDDHDDLRTAGDLPFLASPTPSGGVPPRRLKVWEIGGHLQCSILGTCCTHEDLLQLLRKVRLQPPPGLTDYQLHAYFVRQSSTPSKVARAVQKLLEQRHAGIVRRVGALSNPDDLAALWAHEVADGRIAGAYWAFLTHTHIPEPLQTQIFGEVHMMSHIVGRTYRQTAGQISVLHARIDDLEARHQRQAERHRQVVAERDRAVAAARAARALVGGRDPAANAPICTHARPPSNSTALSATGDVRWQRRERALLAARARARGLECEVDVLKTELARLRSALAMRTRRQGAAPHPSCPAAEACAETVRADIARRVLYLGGRDSAVETLRAAAARLRAELVHHDGGIEHNVHRIDTLVEGCDVVFCPVDCISHAACLRAKALCRRMKKPFVPLRSSGVTAFERALEGLSIH
jgi:hypothetical protein